MSLSTVSQIRRWVESRGYGCGSFRACPTPCERSENGQHSEFVSPGHTDGVSRAAGLFERPLDTSTRIQSIRGGLHRPFWRPGVRTRWGELPPKKSSLRIEKLSRRVEESEARLVSSQKRVEKCEHSVDAMRGILLKVGDLLKKQTLGTTGDSTDSSQRELVIACILAAWRPHSMGGAPSEEE